jgi:hypothetical protein
MVTYLQLATEQCYRDETPVPALITLTGRLKTRYPGMLEIGMRGDNEHLDGYHRSRRWVQQSQFCTNRFYSVSRTPGDQSGGNDNWYTAIDIGAPQQLLFQMCKRLDAGIRSGRFEKITEWYGNFGDDLRVDGYDNISNHLAISDSSHLTHLHMSFDRGRANENHDDVFLLLTEGDDVSADEVWDYTISSPSLAFSGPAEEWLKYTVQTDRKMDEALAAIAALDAKISAGATVGLTEDQVRAIVRQEIDRATVAA